jgi:hypothetical protein
MVNYRTTEMVEAAIRTDLRIAERALELAMADLSGKPMRLALARQVKAVKAELESAARMAYGPVEWFGQVERLTEVATWEVGGRRKAVASR